MSLILPVTATNIVEWVRLAASAINDLIRRATALEGRASAVETRATSLEAFRASFATLGNYANDAAAATGGVPVGGLYRNGSQLLVRVV